MSRGARSAYRDFWAGVGERFPDLDGAESTRYYADNERRLFAEHFPPLEGLKILKTDLWDEAKNTRILAWASRHGARAYGVDISEPTVVQARAAFDREPLHAAIADIRDLPFRAASFQTVFVRDLLHHMADPAPVLAEVMRVLAPGGRFLLIEPNASNPIVLLQTYLVPAERLGRRSGPSHIERLLRGLPLTGVEMRAVEPLPLRRLVLHYRFGLPGLGRLRPALAALAGVERLAQRLLPPARWSYVRVTASRT